LSYENGDLNKIEISHDLNEIELRCRECGAQIESNEYATDERLHRLEMAIERALEIPDLLEFKHDSETGEIESESFFTTLAK
jgi:hypothetical protein